MLLLPEYSVNSTNVIHCGDALAVLRTLPSNFVHCLVTSPPYYGLRDYSAPGQLGLEDTPDAYLARLVAIFREARRVLRDDGVAWVNMGDSYASSPTGNPGSSIQKEWVLREGDKRINKIGSGFKPKDLMLMPHRLAIALQADGWWVRSDIVWHKPNPMPESVTDRPTKAHEYIFMLTKAERYFYDADAVREPALYADDRRAGHGRFEYSGKYNGDTNGEQRAFVSIDPAGRNLRSVWTVATQPYAAAHFATYPPDLIRPCIRAGCPERVCLVCGRGWVRVVEKGELIQGDGHTRPNNRIKSDSGDFDAWSRPNGLGATQIPGAFYQRQTLGFRPDCDCHADGHVPGIVLDPFMGSGTTALVAVQERRRYVGIELNREYIALAQQRFMTGPERLNAKEPEPMTDLPLFAQEASWPPANASAPPASSAGGAARHRSA